jgi:hypothetical protein
VSEIATSSVLRCSSVIPESYGSTMPAGPRKYTDEQLASALGASRSMREVLIALGLAPKGGNYETVWRRIRKLHLDASHFPRFQRGRSIRSCTAEEIIGAVQASKSMAQVLVKLGVRRGGNQSRLKSRIVELGIDVSHLQGQAWRRGSTIPAVPARPLSEILVAGRLTHTGDLKKRLFAACLKEARCEGCGLDYWNGQPIPLELEHVNGKRDDNRLHNLRILCPNCHAQTPTYRGRNIGSQETVS